MLKSCLHVLRQSAIACLRGLRQLLMRIITLLFFRERVPASKIHELRRDLFKEARLESSFVVLVVGSGLIATFGLLNNSAAVIIGAMIIAPLMRPIRALAFGILKSELSLVQRSLVSILVGSGLTIGLACMVTMSMEIAEFGSEVLARTEPNLLDLGVAVVAGVISAYSKVEEEIGDAVAGTAIAVALAPPLCVVGLGLSLGLTVNDWSISQGALLLFLTNWVGITLACMIVFALAGYTPVNTPQSRRALSLTFGMTLLLTLPLGLSLRQLLQESTLTRTIRNILVRETVTVGQQVTLDRLVVDWRRLVPEVQLFVSSSVPPTPKQAQLVEDYLSDEMGRRFHLVFYVNELQEVRPEDAEAAAEAAE